MPVDQPALSAFAAERLDQRANQVEGFVQGIPVVLSAASSIVPENRAGDHVLPAV
jgi:hypothetical protein